MHPNTFIGDLSPSPPRGTEANREHESGCNYRGRLAVIRERIDRADYHEALYELNQLTGYVRTMKQSQPR